MSGLVRGKYWTTESIRHPKRKLCSCCPYGAHIDVDYEKFYSTLMKIHGPTDSSTACKYPRAGNFRNQDETIDALLGYDRGRGAASKSSSKFGNFQNIGNIDEFVQQREDFRACASPDVQQSFEQALHDFEEILEQSNVRSPSSSISYTRPPSISPYESPNLPPPPEYRSDFYYSTPTSPSLDTSKLSKESSNSPIIKMIKDLNLQREENDANGLTKKIEILENKVKIIPELQARIKSLECEKNDLIVNHATSGCSCATEKTKSEKTYLNRVKTRDTAVGCCKVVTRDVGTIHSPAKDEIFHISEKKLECTSVATQTLLKITAAEIIKGQDQGTQVGASFYASPSNQVYEDKYPNTCALKDILRENKVTRKSHGYDIPLVKPSKSVACKYCQTVDIIVKCAVISQNSACQTSIQSKDAGTNPTKENLRDFATSTADDDWGTCRRNSLPNGKKYHQGEGKANEVEAGGCISKIPIPILSPPAVRKTLIRQDTYVERAPSVPLHNLPIISPTLSPRLNEQTNCSDSDDIEAYKPNVTQCEIGSKNSSFHTVYVENPKSRIEGPSNEMKAAMNVLNDSLQTEKESKFPPAPLKNCLTIIQKEWFQVSSLSTADALEVEDYLNNFESISNVLLEYIVNMRDGAGNTAMHYAISHGNFDVVSTLLDSKVCNVNAINDAGYACTMLVSLINVQNNEQCEVIKRLFKMADVNLKAKKHGQTTLMLAVSHGKYSIVQLLLENGADVNIRDDDGSTALMCAAEHGYIDIVKMIVSQPDCDITAKDNDGSSALSIAMEAGHREIGVALYARQHFCNVKPLREKRSRSAATILMGPRLRNHTPTIPKFPAKDTQMR